MAETKHTPGKVTTGTGGYMLVIEDGFRIASTADSKYSDREARANTARLALCWNSHEHLTEACRQMAWALRDLRDHGPGLIAPHGDALEAGIAALALAGEKTV